MRGQRRQNLDDLKHKSRRPTSAHVIDGESAVSKSRGPRSTQALLLVVLAVVVVVVLAVVLVVVLVVSVVLATPGCSSIREADTMKLHFGKLQLIGSWM